GVTATPRDYGPAHPNPAFFAWGIAELPLAFEPTDKATITLPATIAVSWARVSSTGSSSAFPNLNPTQPQPFGWGYADRAVLSPGATASPLAAPQATIAVADLLP